MRNTGAEESKDEVYREARELLLKMGLSDKEDAIPELSGGETKSIAERLR